MLDYLQQRGRLSQAEYDANRMAFSAMTIDVASQGVEVEFVANPMPNWTMRAGFSYTDRGRENYFVEREPHLSQSLAFIRARDDRGVMTNGLTVEQEIASLLQQIQETAENQEGSATGSRPIKASCTTRYRFATGAAKGIYLGGSFIYQSSPLLQLANDREIRGNDVRQVQLFAGQTFRLPWRRATLRLQVNVYNAGNVDVVDPGRYSNDLVGMRRVYLREPRSVRVTSTLEF
jgi:outer membrane receptor protein involved in Fe transport